MILNFSRLISWSFVYQNRSVNRKPPNYTSNGMPNHQTQHQPHHISSISSRFFDLHLLPVPRAHFISIVLLCKRKKTKEIPTRILGDYAIFTAHWCAKPMCTTRRAYNQRCEQAAKHLSVCIIVNRESRCASTGAYGIYKKRIITDLHDVRNRHSPKRDHDYLYTVHIVWTQSFLVCRSSVARAKKSLKYIKETQTARAFTT